MYKGYRMRGAMGNGINLNLFLYTIYFDGILEPPDHPNA